MWCQRIQMTFSEFVSVTHIDGSLKGIPISGSSEQTCFSVDLCPEVYTPKPLRRRALTERGAEPYNAGGGTGRGWLLPTPLPSARLLH